MSHTRARWSDAEKKAVLDAYHQASDAAEFFALLDAAMGPGYVRRTAKAYLTYLNETLLPKAAPRRPVYQSLCDENQKELAEARAVAAFLADITQESNAAVARYGGVLTYDEKNTVSGPWVQMLLGFRERLNLGNFTDKHAGEIRTALIAAADKVDAAARSADDAIKKREQAHLAVANNTDGVLSQSFEWVVKEVDVVPRVPPGRKSSPSLFRDPTLPTLNEALAAQAANHAAATQEAAVQVATQTTPSTEAEAPRPAVKPDPTAVVPKHYPPLPDKEALTAGDLAQVFNLQRTTVADALAYGFLPTLNGSTIRRVLAEEIHRIMSEGHSFSEACRRVNPSSSGLLPMEALNMGPQNGVEPQEPVVVPGTQAGSVSFKADGARVSGGPLNERSFQKVVSDHTAVGVKDIETPKSLFRNPAPTAPSVPTVKQVEMPVAPTPEVLEVTPATADPKKELSDLVDSLTSQITSEADHRQFTLEAVHAGILSVEQGVTILEHRDEAKCRWALGLLAATKITVVQCDRLLFAK